MLDELFRKLRVHRKKVFLIVAALVVLDGYLWSGIVFAGNDTLKIHFLSVGQGDSGLVLLPGGATILIDGGPANGRALEEIGAILGPTDRHIDLMVLSHPQLDHYGGFIEVARRYDIGAFLWNGEMSDSAGFQELLRLLRSRNIPTLKLLSGDSFCFLKSCGDVVWPQKKSLGEDVNERSLVLALRSAGVTALFTGDLGSAAERAFLSVFREDIDILKVGHHGSKYSTSREFLKMLRPEVAVIEVGKNSYGHPSAETLARLSEFGARILRSDDILRWSVEADGSTLRIFSD